MSSLIALALAMATSVAHALPDEPPSLQYLEWDECIDIECWFSPEYPVLPSYHPYYLGMVVHRGPSPATISDICRAAYGAYPNNSGWPIHGMIARVYTTQYDSGMCVDPEPVEPPELEPFDWDDYEKTMAELETKWESPGEVFDPDASMDWP